MTSVTYNADEIVLFWNQEPSISLNFQTDPCQSGTKSREWVTVLLACNVDGGDKLTPFVNGKYRSS